MDRDGFWGLVGAARAAAADPVDQLAEELAARPDADVVDFDRHLREELVRANDWRLWAAGYLLQGGMSDDAFEHFRLWLVLQGRGAFDRALADPDSLADLDHDEDDVADAETLLYLPAVVLERRGGAPAHHVDVSGEPRGEPFLEDDDWFREHLPRLWELQQAAPPVPAPEEPHPVAPPAAPRPSRPAPAPVPLSPHLAAALHHLGELDPRRRPMVAAEWLAEGHDGDALRDLAWLRGPEAEVGDLWPDALAELGVALPLAQARRLALPWAADRVLRGERGLPWLARFLLPHHDEGGDDPGLDLFAYEFDHVVGWASPGRFEGSADQRARAQEVHDAMTGVVTLLAEGDLAGAQRLLSRS